MGGSFPTLCDSPAFDLGGLAPERITRNDEAGAKLAKPTPAITSNALNEQVAKSSGFAVGIVEM